VLAITCPGLAAGCGGPHTVTVEGIVTFQGKPVEDAAVMFLPAAGGRPSVARTNADGHYQIDLKPGAGAAAELNYNVTITAVETPPAESTGGDERSELLAELNTARRRPRWKIPRKYSRVDASGLQVNVQTGQNNIADFKLTQ
jgi:hypothetical protein